MYWKHLDLALSGSGKTIATGATVNVSPQYLGVNSTCDKDGIRECNYSGVAVYELQDDADGKSYKWALKGEELMRGFFQGGTMHGPSVALSKDGDTLAVGMLKSEAGPGSVDVFQWITTSSGDKSWVQVGSTITSNI